MMHKINRERAQMLTHTVESCDAEMLSVVPRERVLCCPSNISLQIKLMAISTFFAFYSIKSDMLLGFLWTNENGY